ncbi:MAG: tRNA uridine(34) 5-carboxymethylaminomethyl modification radical SAM/GNAT enzyme Elp3 [Thermoplasmata archaeon]
MSAPPIAPSTPDEIHREKLSRLSRRPGDRLPSNVEWVSRLPPEERERYRGVILRRPTRTLSGVAVVAVMTAPAACPHGRCVYCPGGLETGTPQSYTGEEPSALRGAQFHWDAERITRHRIEALEATGHPTSKVDVIVMGGTFPSRPPSYQRSVFQGIYDALNGRRTGGLEEAQRVNETSSHRLVGLTVETRPDWCDARVLPFLLGAGVTRVEIGVECLEPEVLGAMGRAHGVKEVVRATREARASGLKVCYHMMLGLPGMDPGRDLAGFRRLFEDPAYRPDMLKIYPTLVVGGTPLAERFADGSYRPYTTDEAADLLVRIKKLLPPWVRIQRVQRDIPARLIVSGPRAGNLREIALRRLEAEGLRCPCLRCREVGRRAVPDGAEFHLVERDYEVLGGRERFLSFEEEAGGAVAGYLRLSMPGPGSTDPAGSESPIVRELKVLGREVPVGTPGDARGDSFQHRGLGRALMDRAAVISREEGYSRLRVMSAVGTRPYYARLGFARDGPWMARTLGP